MTSDCEPALVFDCDDPSGEHSMPSDHDASSRKAGLFLPSVGVVWTIRVICLLAVGISGYLAWTAFSMGEVYGCGSGAIFDCSHVLTSKWSKLFGVPVSVPAVALWGSLLATLMFARTDVARQYNRTFWSIVTVGAFSAGLAALWFIGIQVFVLQHLCVYCLVAHTCGLVLAGMMFWMRPMGWSRTMTMGAPAMAGFLMLSLGQYFSPEPQTFIVERFDSDEPDVKLAEDDTAFAPPTEGSPLAAPELFAPPGELFEPPADATSVDPPSTDAADTGRQHEEGSASDSAVAARLLLIHPGSWLTQMIMAAPEYTSQDAGSAGDNEANKQTDEETSEADEAKAGDTAEEPEPRLVSVQGKKFVLDSRQWPLIGDPDSRYIFVEMLDYTCPHCRATHSAVKGACRKFGDDLAVIVLPVPLDRSCNPYASGGGHAGACELGTMAVAVWRLAPEKFGEYHNWLMEGGRSRSPSEARRKAEQLVGAQELKAELDKKVAAEYIKRHVELYRRVGSGSVPKIMFPNATMTGAVHSTTTLCSRIERELAGR